MLALVVLALLSGACSVTGTPVPAPAAGSGPVFGVLGAQQEHAAEEVRAGVPAAMIEMFWDRAEPADGTFDRDYLRSVASEVRAARTAGRTVTLALGLHYAPQWLLARPGARFVDQSGKEADQPDLVFDQVNRTKAEEYLGAVGDAIDLAGVSAIRLTSGGNAEILYPGGNSYWAYGEGAQNGPEKPASLRPNPMPGWRPGDPAPQAQVRAFADWYVTALDDVVAWQANVLSSRGFRGEYQLLTPGVGVLPAQYDDAVRGGLPPGLLGSGAAWATFYAGLPQRADLVAYTPSVADGSGDDGACTPADARVSLTSDDVQDWSAVRWLTRLATEHGLPISGENPGWQQPGSSESSYQDTSDGGMLATAVRQVRACGLRTFYWAHDEQLWDGTLPFSAYAAAIGSK
ncbi:hypothetical protein GCM10009836_40830 [Pseudonocardia ailaonensis]|uniref:Glycoside hydrolase family 42 N-terminal domain-containing protein n=1 Tax=Pseudonocardia ailaonensis TaxID=367279 RepID=A0ABN2N8J1_9PSEU